MGDRRSIQKGYQQIVEAENKKLAENQRMTKAQKIKQYNKIKKQLKEDKSADVNAALRDRGTSSYEMPADEVEARNIKYSGMEGPFKMHNGKLYYYSVADGYMEQGSDIFVEPSSPEFYALTGMN